MDGNDLGVVSIKRAGDVERISIDRRHEKRFRKRTGVSVYFDRLAAHDHLLYIVIGNLARTHALLRMRCDEIPIPGDGFLQCCDVDSCHASLRTA